MAAFVGTGLAYNTPPDAPTVLGEEKTLEGRKKIWKRGQGEKLGSKSEKKRKRGFEEDGKETTQNV